MSTFRAKPNLVDAQQWDGTNGTTLLTAFGSHIVSYPSNPDGSLTITTTEGKTFPLFLGDWLHLDIENKLVVVTKVAMYKSYDYVSG